MIFAEIQYQDDYSDIHVELVQYVESKFPTVESGLQGDSWIWVFDGSEKVAIDTFTSMKQQVKCEFPNGSLINKVISTLSNKYKLHVYEKPEIEPHEDV